MFAEAVLGGGLPPDAERHLAAAGLAYQRAEEAEEHLRRAKVLAPDHAAVLIGHYRYYFYKGRLAEALDVARVCLKKALAENGLPEDWRAVEPGQAAFDRYEDVLPRFFLFTLKGYAYLNMRLGRVEEGREAVLKLLQLDPGDKIGARVLLDVADRMGRDDED